MSESPMKVAINPYARVTSEWLVPRMAAQYLMVSVSTLAKWRCYGGGPAFSRVGRSVRYHRTELDLYLEARTVRNTSQSPARPAA